MNKGLKTGFGLVVAALLAMILGIEIVIIIWGSLEGKVHFPGTDKIAVLAVEGIIYDSSRYNEFIIEQREDDSVVALLLRIDSPGGGAAASQEIFAALCRFRDTGKPIIVSIGALGASGGYYLAAAGDTIFANPSSEVGSIGVIFSYLNVEELLNKIGLRDEVFAAGEMKDVPSMSRELTQEERAYLDELLVDVHEQFVADVAERRHMPLAELQPLADGRIFTGRQALKNGLVDALGTFEDAQDEAARLVGIEGEPTLVYLAEEEETGWFGVQALVRDLRALVPAPRARSSLLFQYEG